MAVVIRTTSMKRNQSRQMITDSSSPCELILKIGYNEYDEISTAITTLLRSCSISDQKFVCFERQIPSTSYFASFTTPSSVTKLPIPCQSLSCVILLTNELFQQQVNKDFFKSLHLWNFHHKIELLNAYQQAIARQDYYELSHFLPLWSISHIPYNQQIIIRFNIFTNNFDLMVKFYQHLFQRSADSKKSGFVLFNLSKIIHQNLLYQLTIKYSPSIQSYTISQSAYFKFHLKNLNHFIHEYTRKLFTINQFEYYIYDPDGNLLHLYVHHIPPNIKEYISSKSLIQTNDSGVGDSSSDPSIQFFHSNVSPMYPSINHEIDDQSHSSNDSGQYSSISSNELQIMKQNLIPVVNKIAVRSAKKSEINYRLKQQQKTVHPRISLNQQESKPSLYDSEPRLSNIISDHHRYYSSMNNVQKLNQIHPVKNSDHHDYDTSYEVDSPPITNPSSYGYLNAFLLKKQQQQSIDAQNVQQLIARFEKSTIKTFASRPKSAPLIDQSSSVISKPTKTILQRPIQTKSFPLRSKSVTFDSQNFHNDLSSTTDDEKLDNPIHPPQNSRINIGITLDSRLRKTPVLDMLRSTTMQSDINESQRLNRTYSLRNSFIPIARF